jgi:gamma-glutamyltranspeptidase
MVCSVDHLASGAGIEVLRRPGVARTLGNVATGGRAAFYEGEFGAGLRRIGDGLFTADDLARSQADWVDPLDIGLLGAPGLARASQQPGLPQPRRGTDRGDGRSGSRPGPSDRLRRVGAPAGRGDRGHEVSVQDPWNSGYGHAHMIERTADGTLAGAADPRALTGATATW